VKHEGYIQTQLLACGLESDKLFAVEADVIVSVFRAYEIKT
jgi:hypothetical protein